MSAKIKALQVAFNWMLPKPRPNLREGIDKNSAAKLKVAISIAYDVLVKFQDKIDGNEPFFIYNSWRHICRVLRESVYSPTDHLRRATVYGWVNGCCNLKNPMALHSGVTYMLTADECWDFEGFEGLEILESGRVRLRFRSCEERDCFWVFIYLDDAYSGSFRFSSTRKLVHVYNNLKMMMFESGGLFCVESPGHFYNFSDLLDGLVSGKSCYRVNLPADVYLGKKTEIALHRKWKEGEVITLSNLIDKSKRVELIPSDEKLDVALGQLGEYGLIHLLGLKFDHRTSVILSDHARAFWKTKEIAECALTFLIELNDSRQICKYIKGMNWQRKRYCNDVCHILHLAGYPRLWYYEKDMPATEVCRPFLLCCKREPRDHFILEKGKEDYKEYLKKKRRNYKAQLQDNDGYYIHSIKYIPYKEKADKVSYTIKPQNTFVTKDRVYNTLVRCNNVADHAEQVRMIEKKLPGLAAKSENIIASVFKKLDYVKAIKNNMSENMRIVAEEVRKEKATKSIKESIKNCEDFREKLAEYSKIKKFELDPWMRPKKPFRVRARLGREEVFTNTDNIYTIMENFEADCAEKLESFGDNKVSKEDLCAMKQVVAAEILGDKNKEHKKRRKEREMTFERHVRNIEKSKDFAYNNKLTEKLKTHFYRRMERFKVIENKFKKLRKLKPDDIRRKKKELLTELNQQHRSKKVKNVRDMKYLWYGAKNGLMSSLSVIAFPKIDIVGEYDQRGQWKWDTTKKITNEPMPYWMTLNPDELKAYNKERTMEKRRRKKIARRMFLDMFDL
jgi:hypothetical protein